MYLKYYSLDNKVKYISLNALLVIMVSAAWSSLNQANAIPVKKPIKKIL